VGEGDDGRGEHCAMLSGVYFFDSMRDTPKSIELFKVVCFG
jgi:hypothetical protein